MSLPPFKAFLQKVLTTDNVFKQNNNGERSKIEVTELYHIQVDLLSQYILCTIKTYLNDMPNYEPKFNLLAPNDEFITLPLFSLFPHKFPQIMDMSE